jgi:hypothetical protein
VLWRIAPIDRPPKAGDQVFVCPPETDAVSERFERGYLRSGLCPGGFGVVIKTVAESAASGSMSPASGLLFLHSPFPGSWHSRYFGPVPAPRCPRSSKAGAHLCVLIGSNPLPSSWLMRGLAISPGVENINPSRSNRISRALVAGTQSSHRKCRFRRLFPGGVGRFAARRGCLLPIRRMAGLILWLVASSGFVSLHAALWSRHSEGGKPCDTIAMVCVLDRSHFRWPKPAVTGNNSGFPKATPSSCVQPLSCALSAPPAENPSSRALPSQSV